MSVSLIPRLEFVPGALSGARSLGVACTCSGPVNRSPRRRLWISANVFRNWPVVSEGERRVVPRARNKMRGNSVVLKGEREEPYCSAPRGRKAPRC